NRSRIPFVLSEGERKRVRVEGRNEAFPVLGGGRVAGRPSLRAARETRPPRERWWVTRGRRRGEPRSCEAEGALARRARFSSRASRSGEPRDPAAPCGGGAKGPGPNHRRTNDARRLPRDAPDDPLAQDDRRGDQTT